MSHPLDIPTVGEQRNRKTCTHIGCNKPAKYCGEHGGGIGTKNRQSVVSDSVDDTPSGQILVCFECLVYWPGGGDSWDHCPACGEPALEEVVKEAAE